MKTNEIFKNDILNLMDDYLEVKKDSIEKGFSDTAFNFKDYVDFFIKANN